MNLIESFLTRFSRSRSFYVLHLNNFFTIRKFYQRLYELGIGINGTVKAESGISRELIYLRDTMTKQNDHGEWFNYIIDNVNCIAFYDSVSKTMMTIVYDPTMKEYVYFDRIKRSGTSLKYTVNIETTNVINSVNSIKFKCLTFLTNSVLSTNSILFTNSVLSTNFVSSVNSVLSTNSMYSINSKNKLQYLRKLYVLDRYNIEMSDLDNHVKLNSYYLISRHYH